MFIDSKLDLFVALIIWNNKVYSLIFTRNLIFNYFSIIFNYAIYSCQNYFIYFYQCKLLFILVSIAIIYYYKVLCFELDNI